ncbi:MAG TPA: GNAT family N-acetyltransferase [Gemmatimonadales bacterium]|nr:GNAT family N-acetyltransferase [Gemmatimonadales bacterium]
MNDGFPDRFASARLQAERLTPDHLSEVRRMHRDSAVMAQLGGVRTEDQTAAYMTRNLRHWTDYGFGLWILRERGGGDPVGRAVLRHLTIEDGDEVEVGYAFYQPFWGRGLATEIAARCVALAEHELGLAQIVGLTDPANQASRHVLEKVGLTYERDCLHENAPTALFRKRLRV